jgi:hypothetical protein
MFKNKIHAYSDNHIKPTSTVYRVNDRQSRWYIQLPLGFTRLKQMLISFYNLTLPVNPSSFPIWMYTAISPFVLHAPSFQPSWYDHTNNLWQIVQISPVDTCIIMQFFQPLLTSSHFGLNSITSTFFTHSLALINYVLPQGERLNMISSYKSGYILNINTFTQDREDTQQSSVFYNDCPNFEMHENYNNSIQFLYYSICQEQKQPMRSDHKWIITLQWL